MWILLSAIVTASILGSMHCVGMCGPLALWASGSGQAMRRSQVVRATGLYHIGRLITYITMGGLAGAVGQLADFGGDALGVQLFAARIAGGAMVAIGIWKLWQILQVKLLSKSKHRRASGAMAASSLAPPKAGVVAGILLRLRPIVFKQSLGVRALLTGLLTVLLPCGWLYIFALAAAGSGSAPMGALVMTAFWTGTVPALVGLVASSALMATKFRTAIPALAALVLIAGGCFTASGRGFAKLNSLSDISPVRLQVSTFEPTSENVAIGGENVIASEKLASQIEDLTKTPLPCCSHAVGGESK